MIGCGENSSVNTIPNVSRTTLGIVQKEIRKGMSQAEVAQVLGSPNIVTTDSKGNETWIYDKIATEVSHSENSGGLWLIFLSAKKGGSYTVQTQRTLTIIIKFDKYKKVKDVAYHMSQF
jgi:outer membrane protein assembly factor BamE (lipoprotein component of BamABCDE complex)